MINTLFKRLNGHKKKILFFTLLSTILAFTFAYMKPNIYLTSTEIKIGLDKASYNTPQSTQLSNTINLETEMKILKSRKLIEKALERGDFRERYYATSIIKEKELYQKTPFEVTLSKGENLSFYVTAHKEASYLLEVEGIDIDTQKKWKVSEICNYGEAVKEDHFSLTLFLKNNKKLMEGITYRFIRLSPRHIIDIAQKNLSISRESDTSNTLTVNYTDTVPLRAQEFLNILAKVYLEQSIHGKTLESSRILNFIDRQLDGINNDLEHSQQNLESFKKQSKMAKVGKTTENIGSKLSEYKEKFSELTEEEQFIDELYQQVIVGNNYTNISTAGLNLSSTGLPRLIEELQKIQKEKKLLRINYTLAHPIVRKLTQNISHTQNSIATTIKNLKNRITKRKKILQKMIKDHGELLNTLPEKEKIFGGLQRKFIMNEKIYAYVLEKRASTAIAKASMVSPSSIIDTAQVPLDPIAPKRVQIVTIGFLLGLLLGIFISLLLEVFNNRIKNEDDIRENSTLPLLGVIPHMSSESNQIKVFESPKSIISEAFRTLRTNLQFFSNDNKTMIISVTSSVGGEGKSTVTTNLASIISLTGKKTIILNMDMRKPTLHQKFDLKNDFGISNLLAKRSSLKDVIQKSKYENIDVITSGPFHLTLVNL